MGCRKKTKKKKIQKKLSKKWKVEKLVLLTRIRVIATDVIEKCEYFSRHIRGDNTNCTQRAATRWRRQTAIQKKKKPNKFTLAFFANKNDFRRNTEQHIVDLICNNFEFAVHVWSVVVCNEKQKICKIETMWCVRCLCIGWFLVWLPSLDGGQMKVEKRQTRHRRTLTIELNAHNNPFISSPHS